MESYAVWDKADPTLAAGVEADNIYAAFDAARKMFPEASEIVIADSEDEYIMPVGMA